MNDQDYFIAWGAYLGAGLGLTLVSFLATRWMWRWLREILRGVIVVLLFTPTPVDPTHNLYAPAIAVTALDGLFKVGNNTLRVASDLALVLSLYLLLYLMFALIRWPIERASRRRRAERAAADEPTLQQLMQPELMPGVDTRTDERGERRMRIEPRL